MFEPRSGQSWCRAQKKGEGGSSERASEASRARSSQPDSRELLCLGFCACGAGAHLWSCLWAEARSLAGRWEVFCACMWWLRVVYPRCCALGDGGGTAVMLGVGWSARTSRGGAVRSRSREVSALRPAGVRASCPAGMENRLRRATWQPMTALPILAHMAQLDMKRVRICHSQRPLPKPSGRGT